MVFVLYCADIMLNIIREFVVGSLLLMYGLAWYYVLFSWYSASDFFLEIYHVAQFLELLWFQF